jgi:phage terminase small subunit
MADLTDKQKAWANAYLETFNKTEAARRAGYDGNDVSLAKIGSDNYRKVQIMDYIRLRLDERLMSADEVLIRLTEHARGDLSEFADIQLMTDLKQHPKAHLIKRLTMDVYEDKNGKVHYKTHFELYDAQAALDKIMRYHGMYNDKVEISWRDRLPPNTDADEVKRQFIAAMQQAADAPK